MKNILFFLITFLCANTISWGHPQGKVSTYTLQEAIEKKLAKIISVKYIGEKKLQIVVANIHNRKDIKIHFQTGLQFASRDTSEQDQIILQERILLVKADKSIKAAFVGYCTQATNLSPGKESLFDLKEIADGKLLQLCEYLSKIKGIEHTTQHAVWTVTNDHDLKGLYHEDAMTAIKIQHFVSDLTGKPLPKYTVKYKDGSERQVAFNAEAILIVGAHEYDLTADAVLSCYIYNETGEMVQKVFKDMEQKRGHIKFQFKLKALDLPPGKYVSKVFKGEVLLQEIWVES